MELIKRSVRFAARFSLKNKSKILFLLLLGAFFFLRFYQLQQRAVLGWDQADSAWAAKSILFDNPIKLQGVPIKGNASLFMGPLYYYLITPFYFFSQLDMIASPIFAGVVSVLSLFVFYYITKKMFTTNVALVAVVFYTFSFGVIMADRVQAAYVLIPILSYIIFYFLYKFILGEGIYLLYCAAIIGLGFHIHFTTIFYFPIMLLSLPFSPRTKKTFLYELLAIPVLLLFLSPMLYPLLFAKHTGSNSIVSYLIASYHGLHMTRIVQIAHDAFISFQVVLETPFLRPLVFLLLPLFAVILYSSRAKKQRREVFVMVYLIALWILVPWILFATYNGELTDYYFSLPRNLGIAMSAFLLVYLYNSKFFISKLVIVFVVVVFAGYNLYLFSHVPVGNYLEIKRSAETAMKINKKVKFIDRDPFYFTYYVETHYRKK